MLRYGLRRRDVAELLGKPLNSAGGYSNSTIDRWLSGANQVSVTGIAGHDRVVPVWSSPHYS
jgi:transcriptional regulator with XRE-family HTH domain